jgi:hypothetical protein
MWALEVNEIVRRRSRNKHVRRKRRREKKKYKKINLMALCLINYVPCPEIVLGSGGITPQFLTSALPGGD